MIEIRSLKPEGIEAALVKARQYRLLNEPDEAVSICLDILAADPNHQNAMIHLILAYTDKFADSGLEPSFKKALGIVERLDESHCKSYYTGIIYERRGKYHLKKGGPGSGALVFDWLAKALKAYEETLTDCDPDNQDAILRWNSCARIINKHPDVKPMEDDTSEPMLDAYHI
jgi:hypothetical protein